MSDVFSLQFNSCVRAVFLPFYSPDLSFVQHTSDVKSRDSVLSPHSFEIHFGCLGLGLVGWCLDLLLTETVVCCEIWPMESMNMQDINDLWNNGFRHMFNCCLHDSTINK